MFPKICTIGPFTIYSYGLMMAIGFSAALFLASREAKKQKFPPDIIINLLFGTLMSGIVGARLFYVIANSGYYLQDPLEIIMLQNGGLSWFGGFISGLIFGVLYIKIKRLGVYKTFDLIIPFVALAQSIGRIGCLLNGCCYGRSLIPIQIYSSFLLLVIFAVLRLMQTRPHKEGQIFFWYLLLYSVKRFFVEFWRLDNPHVFAGLTLFQALSIVMFFFAAIKLIQTCKITK